MGQGRWWLQINRLAALVNMNHGPLRSGAWGRSKQATLRQTLAHRSLESADFQAAARRTGELLGRPVETRADYEAMWARLGSLPTCNEAGPICKFARWLSINECWEYLRPQVWLLQLVLEDLSPEDTWRLMEQDTTASLDSERARALTTSKDGLLAKAPGYICQELIDVMDLFSIGTASSRALYSHRASQIKTPSDGIAHTRRLAKGAWACEYLDVIEQSIYHAPSLQTLGLGGSDLTRPHNAPQLFAFVLHVLAERMTRELPSLLQWPNPLVLLLDPDEEAALEARTRILRSHDILLAAEAKRLANDSEASSVLSDIHWRSFPLPRLCFLVVASESHLPHIGPQTLYLSRAICSKMPDEKGPEDVHQHIRDTQRGRRHKHIALSTVYDAQIRSSVLEDRKLQCPQITPLQIAQESWRSIKHKHPSKAAHHSPPADWPTRLNDILSVAISDPSPTAPGLYQSFLAWSWLQEHGRLTEAGQAMGFAASWFSRLCTRGALVRTGLELFVVVAVGRWGIHAWDAEKVGPNDYVLSQSVLAVRPVFICSAFEHEVLEIEGHPLDDCVGFKTTGEPVNLLKSALLRRRPFTHWELKSAWEVLGSDDPIPESPAALLKAIVAHFFPGDAGDEILAAYKRPQPIHQEFSEATLQEMSDIIEEMAEADGVNATDIKTYRQDLAKRSAQTLVHRREKRRQEKMVTMVAKKKRTKVNKLLGKAAARLGRGRKARKAAAAPSAPPPGSGFGGHAASSGDVAPGSAAAPVPPPPAAPLARKLEGRRPKEGHGWRVLEVPHGYLRYNMVQGKLDSHCPVHNNCKMDRTLARGPIGLCMAWLRAHAEGPEPPALLKITLSSDHGLEARRRGRQEFKEMAKDNELFTEVLEQEALLRGGDRDEPPKLPVSAGIAAYERAMAGH